MSPPRVVAVLAQGGSGRIELAFRAEGAFRRMYAVKRLRDGLAEDAKVREHFLREAAITTRLRHPNVVHVLDVGTDERGPYLVMDHVLGVSLRELREALGERRMPPQLVWLLGSAIARALHAVHTLTDDEGRPLGLAHRDLTPSNVMVGYDGIVRLVDFGLARASDERTATLLQGTSGYLAPEQLRFESVDGRADLFALGVILFELLHGRRLYGDADVRVAARRTLDEPLDALSSPSNPSAVSPREPSLTSRSSPHTSHDVPLDSAMESPSDATFDPWNDPALNPSEEELVLALLAKAPSDRPPSAREVARRLEGLWRARVRDEGAHDVRAFLASSLEGRERQTRARLAELWSTFDAERSAPAGRPRRAGRSVAMAAIGAIGVALVGALGWAGWPRPGSPSSGVPTVGAVAADPEAEDATETSVAADGARDDDASDPRVNGAPGGDATHDGTPREASGLDATVGPADEPNGVESAGTAPEAPDPSEATGSTETFSSMISNPSKTSRRRRPPRRSRVGAASDMAGLWSW